MKRMVTKVMCMVFCLSLFGPLMQQGYAADVQKITAEELRKILDNPQVIVIDVRTDPEWKKSDQKIKGALREDPDAVDSWAGKYPKDKPLVLYCS